MSDETEEAVDQDAMADEWAAAMEEQGDTEPEPDVFEQVQAAPISASAELGGDVKLDVI